MFYISDSYIDSLIEEDLHIMDLTTAALGIEEKLGRIECSPKNECVLSGVEEAARIFSRVGAVCRLTGRSGDRISAGETFLTVSGAAGALHASYKAAQNVMEYSSGISTRCAAMVDNARSVSPYIEVAVTRKHFPGSKPLSLKAAVAGGAMIHRTGLSDSILVFDQHRVFMGGSEAFALTAQDIARRFPEKKLMAEANSVAEAVVFAKAGVAVVQCERFSPTELTECIPIMRAANPSVKISAAGGVNADNAALYAATGVDIIVTSWPYFGKPEDIKMRFYAE